MNLEQRLTVDQITYSEVAKYVLSIALKDGCQSKLVEVVFDTYTDIAIKSNEQRITASLLDSGGIV